MIVTEELDKEIKCIVANSSQIPYFQASCRITLQLFGNRSNKLTHQWGFHRSLHNSNKAGCKGCACQMFYLTVTEVILWTSALPFLRGCVKVRPVVKTLLDFMGLTQTLYNIFPSVFPFNSNILSPWHKWRAISPHCTVSALIKETGRSLVSNLSKDCNRLSNSECFLQYLKYQRLFKMQPILQIFALSLSVNPK